MCFHLMGLSDASNFFHFSGWKILVMKSSSGGSYNEALGNATNGTDLSGIITCCSCASISVID